MGHLSIFPKTPAPPDPSWPGQILLRARGESKPLLPEEQHKGDVEVLRSLDFGARGNEAFEKIIISALPQGARDQGSDRCGAALFCQAQDVHMEPLF